MQLLFLLSLAVAASALDGPAPPNCRNEDSCDTTDYMEQISCEATHTDTSKECTCKATGGGDCADFTPVTNAAMTKEICAELCTKLDQCVFYRWDKTGYTNVITCTLMNEQQCSEIGESCLANSCASGAAGNQCDNSDGGRRPEGKPCTVNLPAKSDVFKIKWICFDPYSKNQEEWPVYAADAVTVLTGAICETVDRCTLFGEDPDQGPFLKYTCNVDGIWETTNVCPDLPTVLEDDVLTTEPTCTPADLAVPDANLADGQGTELICSQPKEHDDGNSQWLVKPPNSCAMLCDKHHVVTIQSGWVDRGKGKTGWNLYVVGETEPSSIEDGAELTCW